jgi:hypothetical protein
MNGKSAKLMVYTNSGKAVEFRNSLQDALKPPFRVSFLTEIGRQFHMAGPHTKNELGSPEGILKINLAQEFKAFRRIQKQRSDLGND